MSRPAVAIVGIAECEHTAGPGTTVLQLQAQAARAALQDAGIALGEVDGLLTAGLRGGLMPAVHLAEYLGLQPTFTDSTNLGGAAFEAHVGHAALALEAGVCDVALISFGSTHRRDLRLGVGPEEPVLYSDHLERAWGLPFPVGAYALAAQRHMHEFGTTREQLAEVAVAARAWAALNPRATKRDPITVEEVLESAPIAEPIHRLDCCLVTDGGGALVLCHADRARACRRPPVWVLGHGSSHTHLTIANMPDLTATAAAASGRRALDGAGLSVEEIDVAEVYDSFTITVVLTLEALGFCGPGEGGAFVAGQRTAPGGDFPLNTNGGGLAYCHPGMYGIYLITEAVRQLRGDAGDAQVPNARIAMAHGTGGLLSTAASVVLGRD